MKITPEMRAIAAREEAAATRQIYASGVLDAPDLDPRLKALFARGMITAREFMFKYTTGKAQS